MEQHVEPVRDRTFEELYPKVVTTKISVGGKR